MKRIGILTFHNTVNYGAVLQCFALQETISKFNSNVKIINYQSNSLKKENKLLLKKDNLKGYVKNTIFLQINGIKKIKFFKFINNNFKLTKKITINEFSNYVNNNFDTVIVGSDQVWNSDIINKEENVYFFKDITCEKNSYSASCGNISEENIKNIVSYTGEFQNISVREKELQERLKNEYNKDVELTLDPTLLLTKEEWSKYIPKDNIDEKYGLIYILEENNLFKTIANNLLELKKVDKIYTFSKKGFGIKSISKKLISSPIEFIKMFYNADYTITNSFHGLAFSIIFNKEVFIILPSKRASRLINLVNLLGLQERVIKTEDNIVSVISKKIDYNRVNEIIDKERKKSIEYIKRVIK